MEFLEWVLAVRTTIELAMTVLLILLVIILWRMERS